MALDPNDIYGGPQVYDPRMGMALIQNPEDIVNHLASRGIEPPADFEEGAFDHTDAKQALGSALNPQLAANLTPAPPGGETATDAGPPTQVPGGGQESIAPPSRLDILKNTTPFSPTPAIKQAINPPPPYGPPPPKPSVADAIITGVDPIVPGLGPALNAGKNALTAPRPTPATEAPTTGAPPAPDTSTPPGGDGGATGGGVPSLKDSLHTTSGDGTPQKTPTGSKKPEPLDELAKALAGLKAQPYQNPLHIYSPQAPHPSNMISRSTVPQTLMQELSGLARPSSEFRLGEALRGKAAA